MLELGATILIWIVIVINSIAIIVGLIIIIAQLKSKITLLRTRNKILIMLQKNNGQRIHKWVNIKSRTIEIGGHEFELRPRDNQIVQEDNIFYPSFTFQEPKSDEIKRGN